MKKLRERIRRLLVNLKLIWELPGKTALWMAQAEMRYDALGDHLNEMCTTHIDTNFREGKCWVITIGHYRHNREYINAFPIEARHFQELVARLQADRRTKGTHLGYFDSHPHLTAAWQDIRARKRRL